MVSHSSHSTTLSIGRWGGLGCLFSTGTVADSAPVVPISAQLRYNIDSVNEYIVKKIPVPLRDFSADPRLTVIRSFDVNKPGAEVDELKGGVAGGSLLQGVLRVRVLSGVAFDFSQPTHRANVGFFFKKKKKNSDGTRD